jgi:hypothetical protein
MQQPHMTETKDDRQPVPQTLDWTPLRDGCGSGYTAEDLARARAAQQTDGVHR